MSYRTQLVKDVIETLEAENAKLRELVKALLTCATDGDCDECRLNGATPWHVGKAQLCDGVWDRVRELGVEVEENDVSAGLRVEDAERTQ